MASEKVLMREHRDFSLPNQKVASVRPESRAFSFW